MIRPYLNTDLESLLAVMKLNIPDNFAPSELDDLKTYVQNHSDTYFIMEEDKRTVGGFGYKQPELSVAAIKWIFTHPAYKGKGLGGQAVNHCLELFQEKKDIHTVIVDTSQLAYKFFAKFGFETISEEKDHWGKGLDLVKMKLNLQK